MHKVRTPKRSERQGTGAELKRVLEEVRQLRVSSMAVYRRVIRELDKQRVA
jgi:hypothetical protein